MREGKGYILLEEDPGRYTYYAEELITHHPATPGFKTRDAYAHAQDTQLELRIRTALTKGTSAFGRLFERVKGAIRGMDSPGQLADLTWNRLEDDYGQVDETLGRAMLLASLTAVEHVEDQLHVRTEAEFEELTKHYLTFDEATLLSARAVEAILRKIPLTKEEYDALEARYKSQAFTITRVTSIDIIESLKQDLAEHVRGGGTFAQWRDELDEKFEALGVTRPNSYYLETIYRNNVMRAYNESQRRYARANAHRVALAEYHAIRDERTRPAHRAMHGFKAPLDSPVWGEWWPPNGHRCRCRIVLLSKYVAQQYGLIADPIAPSEHPDEGWGLAPDENLPESLVERAMQYGIPVSIR